MTYGFEVLNEFGEQVFDFSKSLTIKETGGTVSSITCGITVFQSGSWLYRGPRTTELFTFDFGSNIAWANAHPHFCVPSSQFFPSNTFNRHPTPLVDLSSLYFYQVGTIGLAHHSEHTLSPPWATPHGMFAVCLPANNVTLPFLRVDAGPVAGLIGNYGLRINDAGGDAVFDSRSQFLSISEVLFVPKATIQNILDNNVIVDLSLRTPVSGAYIAAPNHTSFFAENGPNARYRHVVIEQPNSSTIRLRRYLHGPFLNLTNSPSFGVNNDLIIIVARNPFA